MVKTVAVLLISFEAESDKALLALSCERLLIDPTNEVKERLLRALMLEKFWLEISLLEVMVMLFAMMDPALVIFPNAEIISISPPA